MSENVKVMITEEKLTRRIQQLAQQIREGVKGTKFELNGYMLPNADGNYQYRFLSALPL